VQGLRRAAGLQVWKLPHPDFAASLAILAGYNDAPVIGDATPMWFGIVWGATLVGLHRTDAVGRLARAVHLADRHGVPPGQDLALCLLAIAAAEAGYEPVAATLAGYSDANLRHTGRTRPRTNGSSSPWTALSPN
jgi:hypothetical protein